MPPTPRKDAPAPLLGPNTEFRAHHDVTDRKVGGKRVFTKLEQLLKGYYIRAEASEAGRRFTNDYLRGPVARSRSCLDIETGGGGGDRHLQYIARIDAVGRYNEAAAVLNAIKDGPTLPGRPPVDLLIECCVEDVAFVRLAQRTGVSEEAVRSQVAKLLTALADHYANVDRKDGRSTTVYTDEAALKRFEPELK